MPRKIRAEKIKVDGFNVHGQYIAYDSSVQSMKAFPQLIASPLEIPDCNLWLDSADYSEGDSVSQWTDKSTAANHFNAANGTPQIAGGAVRFPDGYGPYLSSVNGALVVKTFFYLVYIDSSQNASCCPPLLDENFHGDNSGYVFSSQWSALQFRRSLIWKNGLSAAYTDFTKNNAYSLLTFKCLAGDTVSFSKFPAQGGFSNRQMKSSAKEMISYSRYLSTAEIKTVHRYLSDKHQGLGVTIFYE